MTPTHDERMASAAPPRLPSLRPRSTVLLLLVVLLVVALDARPAAAYGMPPVRSQQATFRGSGCRDPATVVVDSRFDDTGGLIRVRFEEPFAASSGHSARMARVTCNGVIPLVIDPGKRIGITQVRMAGYVELGSDTSMAQVFTDFFFPGDRGPTERHRFTPPDTSHEFEIVGQTGTVWSRCGGKHTFRLNIALTASGYDTAITLDNETPHTDGFEYEVIVKDCVADPRREL